MMLNQLFLKIAMVGGLKLSVNNLFVVWKTGFLNVRAQGFISTYWFYCKQAQVANKIFRWGNQPKHDHHMTIGTMWSHRVCGGPSMYAGIAYRIFFVGKRACPNYSVAASSHKEVALPKRDGPSGASQKQFMFCM